jgi:hypothetical protein
VVLAHARALLNSSEQGATEYIDADLRDTAKILTGAARLLDFTKPVAVTLLSILHAIPDSDDPWAIAATLLEAVPPGSYLAISTSAGDLLGPEALARLRDTWKGSVQQQLTFRNREQVARFFAGTDLIEPGLVPVDEWRADPRTAGEGNPAMWAGVGRKP